MNEITPEITPGLTPQPTPAPAETPRTVTLDRVFAHPPAKLWRALTETPLLTAWLLESDFAPHVGHAFHFRSTPMPHWDGLIDCEVLLVDPPTRLAYTWRALGLDSVVTFTLTPAPAGTHLRMEHTGFRADQDLAFKGATYGWQKFLANLDQLLQNPTPQDQSPQGATA